MCTQLLAVSSCSTATCQHVAVRGWFYRAHPFVPVLHAAGPAVAVWLLDKLSQYLSLSAVLCALQGAALAVRAQR